MDLAAAVSRLSIAFDLHDTMVQTEGCVKLRQGKAATKTIFEPALYHREVRRSNLPEQVFLEVCTVELQWACQWENANLSWAKVVNWLYWAVALANR